jgi:hypothetical protein
MPMPFSVNTTTILVGGSYLILYSGYDKPKKQFDIINKLTALVSFNNPSNSLVEINKMVALWCMTLWNAATVASLCSSPTTTVAAQGFADRALLLTLLWHGPYSSWKYASRFDSGATPRSKWIAMYLGPLSAATLFLFTARLNGSLSLLPSSVVTASSSATKNISLPVVAAVSSVIATAHVYFMERAAGGRWTVAMRPFGTLGLVVSGVVSAVAVVAACGGELCPHLCTRKK